MSFLRYKESAKIYNLNVILQIHDLFECPTFQFYAANFSSISTSTKFINLLFILYEYKRKLIHVNNAMLIGLTITIAFIKTSING